MVLPAGTHSQTGKATLLAVAAFAAVWGPAWYVMTGDPRWILTTGVGVVLVVFAWKRLTA